MTSAPVHFASQIQTHHLDGNSSNMVYASIRLTQGNVDLAVTAETQNNYKFIKGKVSLVGRQPDGDSVGFVADDITAFNSIYRSYLLHPSSRDQSVQLRLEGIDAPELHYENALQPFGYEARDYIIEKLLKFQPTYQADSQERYPKLTVVDSSPVSVDVFIATSSLDPHGRPISYLFMDSGEFEDGKIGPIDEATLCKSINYKMLESGYAYLLAYTSMPQSHFRILKQIANSARTGKQGVWEKDATRDFSLSERAAIEGIEAQLIYPKLFRRCIDFFKSGELDLKQWLRNTEAQNDMVRITESTTVTLSSLVQQTSDHVSFQADTNDIIFIEK